MRKLFDLLAGMHIQLWTAYFFLTTSIAAWRHCTYIVYIYKYTHTHIPSTYVSAIEHGGFSTAIRYCHGSWARGASWTVLGRCGQYWVHAGPSAVLGVSGVAVSSGGNRKFQTHWGGLDVNFRVRMSENWDSSPKPADWSKKRGVSYQMIHSETTYGCPIDNCDVVCCFWDLWDFHPRLNPHIDHLKKHTHTHPFTCNTCQWMGLVWGMTKSMLGTFFLVKVPPLYG